jgi:hypothetical protein
MVTSKLLTLEGDQPTIAEANYIGSGKIFSSRLFQPAGKLLLSRRYEVARYHLAIQRAVHVLNVNATFNKTFRSFENQSVPLVFGNRQIQCTLDGLGLRLGAAREARRSVKGATETLRAKQPAEQARFGRA